MPLGAFLARRDLRWQHGAGEKILPTVIVRGLPPCNLEMRKLSDNHLIDCEVQALRYFRWNRAFEEIL